MKCSRVRPRTSADCNLNGIPDDCDIALGTSLDCNGNSIPDGGEYPGCIGILTADMNCDGVTDGADVHRFTSYVVDGQYTCQVDMNQDGMVDVDDIADFIRELLGLVRGDVNSDGRVDVLDVDAFVLALIEPGAFASQYPNGNFENADVNNDEAANGDDIQPFVQLVLSP